MDFRTVYSKRPRYYSESGEQEYWTWKIIYDKSGRELLVHDQKKSMYSEIQSHADSVDIHVLIDRYERGDFDALNSGNAQFADIVDMPKSLAELYQRTKDTENYFNGLPKDVREKYNFSASEFLASFDKEVKENAES